LPLISFLGSRLLSMVLEIVSSPHVIQGRV
jgi:hypothetical protein